LVEVAGIEPAYPLGPALASTSVDCILISPTELLQTGFRRVNPVSFCLSGPGDRIAYPAFYDTRTTTGRNGRGGRATVLSCS